MIVLSSPSIMSWLDTVWESLPTWHASTTLWLLLLQNVSHLNKLHHPPILCQHSLLLKAQICCLPACTLLFSWYNLFSIFNSESFILKTSKSVTREIRDFFSVWECVRPSKIPQLTCELSYQPVDWGGWGTMMSWMIIFLLT
jgi:hypothetical protein